MTYQIDEMSGFRVLHVMAAEAEYGQNLQARIKPLMTGVGPVEAAVQLTRVLTELATDDRQPDLIISLGSAGSAILEHTEIYQATSVSYRDMDASPLGFIKGATPFLDQPVSIKLPHIVPGLKTASLSTGANIVSGSTYGTIDADMVDMESYALVRAAMQFNLPLIGLRGISDGRNDLYQVTDWTEYLHIIDAKLCQALDLVDEAIRSGAIPRKSR